MDEPNRRPSIDSLGPRQMDGMRRQSAATPPVKPKAAAAPATQARPSRPAPSPISPAAPTGGLQTAPARPPKSRRRTWQLILQILAWLLVIAAVAAAIVEIYIHYYQ